MDNQEQLPFYDEKKGGEFKLIDPRAVIADKSKNPREDYGDMEDFTRYVELNGTEGLPPITVRKIANSDRYELMHGFRRHLATLTAIENGAKVLRMPAIVKGAYFTDEQAMKEHLTLNYGKPLNAIEEANGMKELLAFGKTEDEIAHDLGKTIENVRALIFVAGLPTSIKRFVKEGKVSATNAVIIFKKAGNENTAIEMITEGLQVAEESGKTKITGKTISAIDPQANEKKLVKAIGTIKLLAVPILSEEEAETVINLLESALQMIKDAKDNE